MGTLWRQWQYGNKPPLGARPIPGHPLAPRISWLMNEGSGSYLNNACGRGSDFTVGGAAPAPWTATRDGIAVQPYLTAGTTVPQCSLEAFPASAFPMTVIVGAVDSDTGAGALADYSTGGNDGWKLLLLDDGTLRFSLSGVAHYSFTGVVSAGGNITAACTVTGNGGTATGYLFNESALLTAQATIGTMGGTPTLFRVGTDSFGNNWTAPIKYCSFYDVVLGADSIASLTAQPYQFLECPSFAVSMFVPSGGATPVFPYPLFLSSRRRAA